MSRSENAPEPTTTEARVLDALRDVIDPCSAATGPPPTPDRTAEFGPLSI